MQIRNDYTSFQNRNYQEGHTHHITECLHDEQSKKKEGASGAGQSQQIVQGNDLEFSKDGDSYQMSMDSKAVKKTSQKSGTSLVKGLWDALGDENSGNNKSVMDIINENLLSGIHGAASSLKDRFQYHFMERIQGFPARLKEIVKGAGAGFRRTKDTFAALTGGQTSKKRESSHGGKQKTEGQVTAAKKDTDIPMKILKHSHLMDSYSRQGEYCQLNDNLTYRKTRSGKQPRKEEQQ